MKRSITRFVALLGVMAATLAIGPSASAVDPLVTAESLVNSSLLPPGCDIAVSNPSLAGSNIQASGQLSCSTRRDALVIQVCIQYRQPFVTEQVTWQELTCGPPKERENTTSVSGSASAPCVPGEWAYRAFATGQVLKNGNVPPNGSGLAVSGTVVISCKLT